MFERNKQPGTKRAFDDFIKTASDVDLNQFKEFDVSILGIWGERDTWVPYHEATKIKKVLPTMKLEVISNAAHSPMETHISEFNQVLVDYLTEIVTSNSNDK